MSRLLWLLLLPALGSFRSAAQQDCAPCHNEQIADFSKHRHNSRAGLQCGVCHGPSEKHRKSNGEAPPERVAAPDEVAGMCGNCHQLEKNQYVQSKHHAAVVQRTAKSANCSTCHGHHDMKEWTATQAGCARCHTTTPAACKQPPLSAGAAKVTCMNCHARHTLAVASR